MYQQATTPHQRPALQKQKGEIVTMLTLAAIVLVGAGLALGIRMGLNKGPQTTKTNAQGSCSYKTYIHVYKEDGETFFGASEIGTLRATNDRTRGVSLVVYGVTQNQYVEENLKFDPTRINNYAENDPATVTLSGFDSTKYRVKRVFCTNRGVRGCPDEATLAQTNAAIASGTSNGTELKGFRVNCGVDLTYGWVLEPVNGGGGPGGGGGTTVGKLKVNVKINGNLEPGNIFVFTPMLCPGETCDPLNSTDRESERDTLFSNNTATRQYSFDFTPVRPGAQIIHVQYQYGPPDGPALLSGLVKVDISGCTSISRLASACLISMQGENKSATFTFTLPGSTEAPKTCPYKTLTTAFKKTSTGNAVLTVAELGGTALTATRVGTSTPLLLDEGGFSQQEYRPGVIREIDVKDRINGDPAQVVLGRLDRSKWKVAEVFCDQVAGSTRGCPTQADLDRMNAAIANGTSDGMTIDEFRVNCNVDLKYGWIIEDVNGTGGGGEPTAVPTQAPPAPTVVPTAVPTAVPTDEPIVLPTTAPTALPPLPTPDPSLEDFVEVIISNDNPNVRSVVLGLRLCPDREEFPNCFQKATFDGRIESQTFFARFPLSPDRDVYLDSFIMMTDGQKFNGRVVVEECPGITVPYGEVLPDRSLRFQKCATKAQGRVHFRIQTLDSLVTFPAMALTADQVGLEGVSLKNITLGKTAGANGGIVFFSNSSSKFTYFPDTKEFVIDVFGSIDPLIREGVEGRFLSELEVSKNEACMLNVKYQHNSRDLSFCGSPQQEDMNDDFVVNGNDFSQCLLDAENEMARRAENGSARAVAPGTGAGVGGDFDTSDDLSCDFDVNRRINALDLSRVLNFMNVAVPPVTY